MGEGTRVAVNHMGPVVTLGLGITFGLVLAADAHADVDGRVAVLDSPPPSGPPGLTPTVSARAVDPQVVDPSPLATIAAGDAMSDRGFGISSAVGLLPAQFDLSMRTVVEHGSMVSVAVGLTHSVEISADAGYARRLADDYGLGVKFTLLRRASYALAIDISLHSTSVESQRNTLAVGDFKITTCALDCNMLLTAGIGLTSAISDYDNQTSPMLELSTIFGRGVVRPLLEALAITGDAGPSLAYGGVRIGGKHVGVDVGVGFLSLGNGQDGSFGMLVGVGVRP